MAAHLRLRLRSAILSPAFPYMDFILDLIRYIGIFALILMVFNLMILVHEWGHFLAARWCGLKVEKFQIWFGKPIWKKNYNGVQYGLGWIPAGGFVALPQMAPMDAIEGKGDEPREMLPPITPRDKIIVAFAGPLFSFLLACLFAVVVYYVGKPEGGSQVTTQIGYVLKDSAADRDGLKVGDTILAVDDKPVTRFNGLVDSVTWGVIASTGENIDFKILRDGKEMVVPVKAEKPEDPDPRWWKSLFTRPQLREAGIMGAETPMVASVQPYSPAEEAGLKQNDLIKTVDGRPILSRPGFAEYVQQNVGKKLILGIERNKQPMTLEVSPRLPDVDERDEKERAPMVGIVWDRQGERKLDYPTPKEQIVDALKVMKNTITAITTKGSDVGVSHLSGFVGIVRVYYTLFELPEGWRLILWFSVVLNVNLAIMNMLPFPVLDGGHIVMATLEWIRRRPINVRLLEVVQSACVLLLLGLMVFITFKDAGDWIGSGGKKDTLKESTRFLPPAERKAPAP